MASTDDSESSGLGSTPDIASKMSMKSPKIHRTPLYRAKAAYANMLRRCGNKCGTEKSYENVELRITKEEWLKWSLPKYEQFIRDFPDEVPNVSRKDDLGHYEIGNISITSMKENLLQRKFTETLYTLTCPVCHKEFVRSAQRVNHKRKNGKVITYSRSCGGKHSRKHGSGM